VEHRRKASKVGPLTEACLRTTIPDITSLASWPPLVPARKVYGSEPFWLPLFPPSKAYRAARPPSDSDDPGRRRRDRIVACDAHGTRDYPPPVDGTSAACDTFKVSLQTVFGSFDITQFAEPGWVWVDPGNKLRTVSGVVTQSGPTNSDFPSNHDSHDIDMSLKVDPGYEGLISNADTGGGVAAGQLGVEWEFGTFTNETSGDPLERTYPRWAWPNIGDRAWFDGNWVFDCGHFDSGNRYNTRSTHRGRPPRCATKRGQCRVQARRRYA
jgi:hypothetical protein